jgi:hypothetical protein
MDTKTIKAITTAKLNNSAMYQLAEIKAVIITLADRIDALENRKTPLQLIKKLYILIRGKICPKPLKKN